VIPVAWPRLPDATAILPFLERIDAARIYSNFGPLVREFEAGLARHFNVEPQESLPAPTRLWDWLRRFRSWPVRVDGA
jgi:hypothetical protein